MNGGRTARSLWHFCANWIGEKRAIWSEKFTICNVKLMTTLQCISLCRRLKRMLSVEKQTLDIFAICTMYARCTLCALCACIVCVGWCVQVYANEITIHLALSNVPEASFRVLFYNLRAVAMWAKSHCRMEIVKIQTQKKAEQTKARQRKSEWDWISGGTEVDEKSARSVASASLEYAMAL